MNDSKSLGVLASLREVAELLAGLDLATLAPFWGVEVRPDFDHDGLCGKAQLNLHGHAVTDLDRIDAVRAWAVALGGVVLLDDEFTPSSRVPVRQLSAVVPLSSGGVFEVWTHLTQLVPSPEWTPADSPELISA
jgi:hypothetical protein